MQPDDAPPGFWRGADGEPALVDGVEIASAVPTRFFQTLDSYPSAWGRLTWRVQLNKIAGEQASAPGFRTFYPGVEWNLRRKEPEADDRWLLTAWTKWEGPGPPYRDLVVTHPQIRIDGDTVLFLVACLPNVTGEPDPGRPLFLRSRVDARDRRSIAQGDRDEREAPAASPGVILLDDLIERH